MTNVLFSCRMLFIYLHAMQDQQKHRWTVSDGIHRTAVKEAERTGKSYLDFKKRKKRKSGLKDGEAAGRGGGVKGQAAGGWASVHS